MRIIKYKITAREVDRFPINEERQRKREDKEWRKLQEFKKANPVMMWNIPV